jgi:hypothetical protein
MIFIGLSCHVWVRIAARPFIGRTSHRVLLFLPLVFCTRVHVCSLSSIAAVKGKYIPHNIGCVQNFFTIYEKAFMHHPTRLYFVFAVDSNV